MNLNNPQVRQRVLEHVAFAISTINAAFTVYTESAPALHDSDTTALIEGLRTPIIMQVLSYTLSLDQELRNTISGPYPRLPLKEVEE